MSRDYDSTFTCALGKKWNIKFKLSQITRFCGEYGIKLEQIMPEYLNEEQILKLSFIGIQHHADAKGIDWEMWLDDNLEGEALGACRDATQMGIFNFILPRLPEKRRVAMKAIIRDLLETDENSENEQSAMGGRGQTQQESPSQQDLKGQNQPPTA